MRKTTFCSIFELFSHYDPYYDQYQFVVSNELKYLSSVSDNLELLHYVSRRITSSLGLQGGRFWLVNFNADEERTETKLLFFRVGGGGGNHNKNVE